MNPAAVVLKNIAALIAPRGHVKPAAGHFHGNGLAITGALAFENGLSSLRQTSVDSRDNVKQMLDSRSVLGDDLNWEGEVGYVKS